MTGPSLSPGDRSLPHYLGLHGAFTNGGDHLIVDRAAALFDELRPDRRLELRDRRLPLDPDDPQVAGATAIILLGGPAWQRSTYPKIHPLADDLGRVRAPIVPFGLGWRGESTRDAIGTVFDERTMELLRRIEGDGCWGSTRDTTTLSVLSNHGLSRQLMTGCPSWYDPDSIGRAPAPTGEVEVIAYSVGARSSTDEAFAAFEQELVASLRAHHPSALLRAVFHHPISPTPGYPERRSERHARLAAMLEGDGSEVVDISGSSARLIEAYARADLHVGMRVHAHLARCSKRQPSVLLAEDARAHVMCTSLGHTAFDAVDHSGERPVPRPEVVNEVVRHLKSAQSAGWPHLQTVAGIIDGTHATMAWMIAALP